MKYEYKTVILSDMDVVENNQLNREFENGWEYVNSTAQHVSTGAQYSRVSGKIVVFLRKEISVNL